MGMRGGTVEDGCGRRGAAGEDWHGFVLACHARLARAELR
jgi:hypothetical protein